jgi:hypothetical protein
LLDFFFEFGLDIFHEDQITQSFFLSLELRGIMSDDLPSITIEKDPSKKYDTSYSEEHPMIISTIPGE